MADFVVKEREDTDDYSNLSVAIQESDGTILSSASFKYTDSSFGKNTIRALIPGGVSTPVQYRRNGHVRKMFDKMHTDAVEEGAVVSLLHPFSFAYYRNFGYEKVADHLILRFPTRLIDFVPRACNFVPYDKSKLSDMIKIYNTFSKGRNLLLKRFNDSRYNRADQQAYICYNGDEPVAYLVYSFHQRIKVNHYTDGVLTVHELAYTSPDALREIFSFLRMFEGEFDDIEFANVAMCPEVDLLLRHYMHTTYTIVPDIMAKVLNTEKLLSANDYPEREGEFTVKVEDAMPSVGGGFKVSYGGGDCNVKRTEDAADIILSSTAFTRLVYGYDGINADVARYIDGVQIDGKAEDFFRAFTKKPCGIFEHF